MLAHSIKPILELIPEALPMIKKASVDQELPLDSRDSAIASALELKYHEHVDGKSIDIFAIEKVAKAVELYGVKEVVTDLTAKMVKAAHEVRMAKTEDHTASYIAKEASLAGDLSGFSDIVAVAATAVELYKEASDLSIEPNETVKRYSGHGYLDKKASVEALAARYQATQNPSFVKIASALHKMDTLTMKPETVFDVCKTVSEMDKEAGLSAKGFNFFREAVMTKSAASALQVKLCGADYPYESIQRLGRGRIAQFIGEDVAKECDASPMNAKQVLETLPRDLQQVLCNLLKNV